MTNNWSATPWSWLDDSQVVKGGAIAVSRGVLRFSEKLRKQDDEQIGYSGRMVAGLAGSKWTGTGRGSGA